jgi:hypothetical protein
MVQTLQQEGHLTPREWMDALSAEIAASNRRGEPDDGSRDYDCWLAALERLVVPKASVTSPARPRWPGASRSGTKPPGPHPMGSPSC